MSIGDQCLSQEVFRPALPLRKTNEAIKIHVFKREKGCRCDQEKVRTQEQKCEHELDR